MIRRWAWNVLISIDQLGNALTGGDPDETISSRLGKYRRRTPSPKWYDPRHWLERGLNAIDPNHALDAIEDDEGAWDLLRGDGKWR